MSLEQRSSFRIPMPDGQKHAQLRVEGRTFEVQLVDASASGVAVACPLAVALEIDDCCELRSSTGNGFIRIVRKEVFADGVLLGAVRTGDKPDSSGGFVSQLLEYITWPITAFSGCNPPLKIALVVGFVVLMGGAGFAAIYWQRANPSQVMLTEPASDLVQPTSPQEGQLPSPQGMIPLPEVKPVVSESDQRAIRILEQQKQLLSPETSRRLRLSPSQENQIERALEAAADASDPAHPEFWESIRRTEVQILKILTPAQVKSWRQLQSET